MQKVLYSSNCYFYSVAKKVIKLMQSKNKHKQSKNKRTNTHTHKTYIYVAQTVMLIRLFVCKYQDFCKYSRRIVHVGLCDCVCVRKCVCLCFRECFWGRLRLIACNCIIDIMQIDKTLFTNQYLVKQLKVLKSCMLAKQTKKQEEEQKEIKRRHAYNKKTCMHKLHNYYWHK